MKREYSLINFGGSYCKICLYNNYWLIFSFNEHQMILVKRVQIMFTNTTGIKINIGVGELIGEITNGPK